MTKMIAAIFSSGHENHLMMDFEIKESFPSFPLTRVGRYPTPDEWRLETFELTQKQKDLIKKVASIPGVTYVLGSFHGEITVSIGETFGWGNIFAELRKIFEEFGYGTLERHEAEDWPQPEKILIEEDSEGVFFHVAKELAKTDKAEYKRWRWEYLTSVLTPEEMPGYEFAKKALFDIFDDEECGYIRISPYSLFAGKTRNFNGSWKKHPAEKIEQMKKMLEEFLQAQ